MVHPTPLITSVLPSRTGRPHSNANLGTGMQGFLSCWLWAPPGSLQSNLPWRLRKPPSPSRTAFSVETTLLAKGISTSQAFPWLHVSTRRLGTKHAGQFHVAIHTLRDLTPYRVLFRVLGSSFVLLFWGFVLFCFLFPAVSFSNSKCPQIKTN